MFPLVNMLFANVEYLVGAFSIWFFTRHTHGKWPWQWGKFGRFDHIGLGRFEWPWDKQKV